MIRILLTAIFMLSITPHRSYAQRRGPTISHEPVTTAAKGQSISILAEIRPGNVAIKTVTLNYAVSRDASPFSQPMTSSHGTLFLGTIPASHLSGLSRVLYYIEAIDEKDEWAETKWNQILIQDIRNKNDPVLIQHSIAPRTGFSIEGSRGQVEENRISTGTIIGGGVLAAGAAIAIVAASDSGGGGSDAGSGVSSPTECVETDVTGTWTGNPEAPGFILRAGGSADFLATVNEEADIGTWGLVDCILTLTPSSSTNEIYRGSGTILKGETFVTINGVVFIKVN